MIRTERLACALLAIAVAVCFVLPTSLQSQTQTQVSRVRELIVALTDADPQVRENAALALGRIGPPAAAAIDPLVATFADRDIYLRGAAAVALGRIGEAAVPALTRALRDANEDVRWSAAIALGRLGPAGQAAVPALITAVSDTNENVRYAAVVALGGLRAAAPEAAPVLTEALHDKDADVRAGARLALQQVAPGARAGQTDRAALVATIDRLVPALMNELHVPGVSIAVIQNREMVWSNAYGVRSVSTGEPVTKDTAFECASMSKPVFAMLAMQLVERKRLDLDRPLANDASEMPVPIQPDRSQITARMAMSHTSGYPNWRPGGEEREGAIPLLFKPGSRFSYSGEGVYYLQQVVERITEQSLDRLAIDNLFRPLGLGHTGYAWTSAIESQLATGHRHDGSVLTKSKYMHPNAAYTLYTTAEEYARALIEMMKAERGESALLSQASAREMLRRQVQLDSREPIERPGAALGSAVYWGLGWSINATAQGDIAHHGGANATGFRSFSQFSPSRGTGIVILTNSLSGGELWTRLVACIGDL
jgi:CubicO group peptidase (beta-lactamase class C family)